MSELVKILPGENVLICGNGPLNFQLANELKKYKLISKPSYERSRLSGEKKVNEFKDGFLILLCILTMFIFRK